MTRNQIEYVKLLETKRSNLANEALIGRRDEAGIAQRAVELREQGRHNRAQEALTSRDLDLKSGSLDETIRHNTMTESLTRSQLSEQGRHNRAQEVETTKHNRNTESLQRIDLREKGRHNLVTETETSTHNRNVEEENKRHNIVGELSDASRIALDTITREQQLKETARHNRAMEIKDMSPKVTVNQSSVQPTPAAQTTPSTNLSKVEFLPSGLPKGSSLGYEDDPMLVKEPPSTITYYMSGNLLDGQKHLFRAYTNSDGSRKWAQVYEGRNGKRYYYDQKGKKHYI